MESTHKLDVIMQLTLIWLSEGSPIFIANGHYRQNRPRGTTFRSVRPNTLHALERRGFVTRQNDQWVISEKGKTIADRIGARDWALKQA